LKQFIAIHEMVDMDAGFYIKWKMRGREQDSGETEKEIV
jgi:hypothetical protein